MLKILLADFHTVLQSWGQCCLLWYTVWNMVCILKQS